MKTNVVLILAVCSVSFSSLSWNKRSLLSVGVLHYMP